MLVVLTTIWKNDALLKCKMLSYDFAPYRTTRKAWDCLAQWIKDCRKEQQGILRLFLKTPWTQIRQRQETTASNWKRKQGDLISQERSYHWPWQPVDILISHRPGPKREVRGWLKVATYRLQSRKDSFLLDPRFRENNDFFSLLHYRFLSDETGARVEWYSRGKNVEIIEPHFAVTQVHFSKSWLFYIFFKVS